MIDLSKLREDFWDNVDPCPITGCWNWTGHINSKTGYGTCHYKWLSKKNIYAHRFTYEVLVGTIPDDNVIDHLCRNRGCCNPLHLEAVSQKTNLMRGVDTIARLNSEKKRCKNGHLLFGDNLRINVRKGGRYKQRVCKMCMADACRRYQQKKRDRIYRNPLINIL